MTAEQTKQQTEYQLLVQFEWLLRVKEEFWEECRPLPRALIEKFAEVRRLLELK